MKITDQDMENVPESVKKQYAEAEQVKKDRADRRGSPAEAVPEPSKSVSLESSAGEPSAAPEAVVVSAGTPTHPTVVVSDPLLAPATENAEQKVARLEAEGKDLRNKLDTFHGNYGGEVQRLKSQIVDMQTSHAAQLAAAASAPLPDGSSEATTIVPEEGTPAYMKYVTADALERYGPEFFKMVSNIARAEDDAKTGDIATLAHAATTRVDEFEAKIEADKFWERVEAIAPGALAINGDPKRAIPSAPGWGDFLNSAVRLGSSLTRRMDAETAIAAGDAIAFGSLIKEFQLSLAKPVVDQPPRPSVLSQAVPKSTTGTPPTTEQTEKRQIPQSEVDEFLANAGKSVYTIEEANAKMKEYAAAKKERRITAGV